MAAVPDVGFDVVAAKIRSIQYNFCPVYGTATGALIGSSRHLKESFTKGTGKRVVDASDTTAPASIPIICQGISVRRPFILDKRFIANR
jgi:hypothetical protein